MGKKLDLVYIELSLKDLIRYSYGTNNVNPALTERLEGWAAIMEHNILKQLPGYDKGEKRMELISVAINTGLANKGFNGSWEDYTECLAYHYFIKSPMLNIMAKNDIVVTDTPSNVSKEHPIERLCTLKNDYAENYTKIFSELAEYFKRKIKTEINKFVLEDYEITTIDKENPDEISQQIIEENDFKRHLQLQKIRTTRDVQKIREDFNRWYRECPTLASRKNDRDRI